MGSNATPILLIISCFSQYFVLFHVTDYYFHYFPLQTHSGHTWRDKRLGLQESLWGTAGFKLY